MLAAPNACDHATLVPAQRRIPERPNPRSFGSYMPLLSHTGCLYAHPQTTLESEHTPTLLGYLSQSNMGANTAQLVSLEKGRTRIGA